MCEACPMTAAYGTLLATVIPVIMIPLLLELRAILIASRDERQRFTRAGRETREEMLIDELPAWAIRLAGLATHPHAVEVNQTKGKRRRHDPEYDRLSAIDALGFTVFYGFLMLFLARSELVALAAARGVKVDTFEYYLATASIIYALLCLSVVPIGLELYVNFGGSRWPNRLLMMYTLTGFLVIAIFFFSIIPYIMK
jgi:hypothetical protein